MIQHVWKSRQGASYAPSMLSGELRYLVLESAALAGNALGSTEDLDALVEKVRQEALLEASHDQERIDRFPYGHVDEPALVFKRFQ